jgi:hypothetical protein
MECSKIHIEANIALLGSATILGALAGILAGKWVTAAGMPPDASWKLALPVENRLSATANRSNRGQQ